MNESDFMLKQVDSLEMLVAHWAFFLEGLELLNQTVKTEDEQVSQNAFLLTHVSIATGQKEGVIYLVHSKNDKPLGFITGFNDTAPYKEQKSLLVYALYSNRKSATASRFAGLSIERWAKANGFSKLHAFSGRTSGSAVQWASRFHGFTFSKLFLTKDI